MKIGIACYPTLGGSGVVATELGMNLADRGHEIHFFSYASPARLQRYDAHVHYHNVEVSAYPLFKYPPYDIALASRMAEVIEKQGLDILHVHYAIPHALSAYLARQMTHCSRVRTVTTLHGTDITLVGQERSYFAATKFGIEQSDGVTAVSQYLKDQTNELFAPDKPIDVIHNFVDLKVFSPVDTAGIRHYFAQPGEKIILHISNFRPVKRVHDVVEAFDLIRRRVPSRLVMVGEGPERSRAEIVVEQKGIQHLVRFLGGRDEVTDLLSLADVFLLPSELETFGLAALEAMACDTLAVGTNRGGMPELITHGVDGFLCDVGSPQCIADMVVPVLLDEARLRRMRDAGLRTARERFSAERIVPQYERYYEKMLAQGQTRQARPC